MSDTINAHSLPSHIAGRLNLAEASSVSIQVECVTFTGGIFRMVTNWNVLVPFGFGEIKVDEEQRLIVYTLSFRQLFIFSMVAASVMTAIPILAKIWPPVPFIPLMWFFIAVVNLATGIDRFQGFLWDAVASAPKVPRGT